MDGWMDGQMNEWVLYLLLRPNCGPHSYLLSSLFLVCVTPLPAGLGVSSEPYCIYS